MGFISDVGFLPQAVATTFGFNDYISWLLPLVTIKQICMHFFLQCTFCRTWVQHMCGSRLHEQYPNINQHNTLYLSSPTCPYFKLSSWLLKVLLEKNFYIKIIGRKIRNLCSYLAIVYNFFFFFKCRKLWGQIKTLYIFCFDKKRPCDVNKKRITVVEK